MTDKKPYGTLSKQLKEYQELRIGDDISIRLRRRYCAYLLVRAPKDLKIEVVEIEDDENEPTDN